jgi:hypothetical protein
MVYNGKRKYLSGVKTRLILIIADQQVHPGLDFLGWYATGSDLQDVDVKIQSKFLEMNGASIFMLYNPISPEGTSKDSLWVFESGEQKDLFCYHCCWRPRANEGFF